MSKNYNLVGMLIAFLSFIIMYFLAKLEAYQQIESNVIAAVMLAFFFSMIGFFVMKFFSDNKKKEVFK
jgi:hypothetical protein